MRQAGVGRSCLDMQERFRRASALPLLLVAAWLWRAKRRAELRAERAEAECQELKSSGVALCAEIRAELLAFSGRVSVAEGPSPISLCLDDCLGIIVSHLQSAVHLANAAMVSNAFRTACRDEAQLRVRGRLVCMRSNYTNPYESGADQIELAAEYAGGWIALLAGREGWLDTSRTAGAPDYEGVPSYTVEHGLDALYNSWNVKSDRSDAGSYAAESKAYDASPAAALCLWDVVRLQTDNVPTGRVRRGEIVWSGVLPLLDQLSVEALHVPNQRVATSNVCRMAVTVPCAASMAEFLPGDRREWRPQTFAVGSDRQSTNDGLHEASPRYLVSGSLDPAADTYLIRLSLLAPGCAETLVCQKSLPSVLDMHVLVGEPLPPHVETLHENGVEAIRLDTGRIDRFEEVDDEDGNVQSRGSHITLIERPAAHCPLPSLARSSRNARALLRCGRCRWRSLASLECTSSASSGPSTRAPRPSGPPAGSTTLTSRAGLSTSPNLGARIATTSTFRSSRRIGCGRRTWRVPIARRGCSQRGARSAACGG